MASYLAIGDVGGPLLTPNNLPIKQLDSTADLGNEHHDTAIRRFRTTQHERQVC